VFSFNFADDYRPGLIFSSGRDLEQIGIVPEAVSLREIDAVFRQVALALLASNSNAIMV
jgi:hypothetical protein